MKNPYNERPHGHARTHARTHNKQRNQHIDSFETENSTSATAAIALWLFNINFYM